MVEEVKRLIAEGEKEADWNDDVDSGDENAQKDKSEQKEADKFKGRQWDDLEEKEQLEVCKKIDKITSASNLPINLELKGEYIAMLSQGQTRFMCYLTIVGRVNPADNEKVSETVRLINKIALEYNIRIKIEVKAKEADGTIWKTIE